MAEKSGALVFEGPGAAVELRRWREALLAVAEGLGAIEAEVELRAGAAEPQAGRGRETTVEPDFDLRKIDLPLRSRTREKGTERDIGRGLGLEP